MSAGTVDARTTGVRRAACWRLSDWQKRRGQDVQTASQIIWENVWFTKNFDPIVSRVPTPPFDHHELAERVLRYREHEHEPAQPRVVQWLHTRGPQGLPGLRHRRLDGLLAGRRSPDCQFPSTQSSEINAFIGKFLGQSTNTNVALIDGSFQAQPTDLSTSHSPPAFSHSLSRSATSG
ncbi:hypothetical protein AURDEDRAFT_170998 [Auricularia subglabra TFB-10046 SS5]|nr:hypothetical protein AURDEDRAFT_170998 [Auricularia subglabra TFB-10046 SS5]